MYTGEVDGSNPCVAQRSEQDVRLSLPQEYKLYFTIKQFTNHSLQIIRLFISD